MLADALRLAIRLPSRHELERIAYPAWALRPSPKRESPMCTSRARQGCAGQPRVPAGLCRPARWLPRSHLWKTAPEPRGCRNAACPVTNPTKRAVRPFPGRLSRVVGGREYMVSGGVSGRALTQSRLRHTTVPIPEPVLPHMKGSVTTYKDACGTRPPRSRFWAVFRPLCCKLPAGPEVPALSNT